MPKKWEDCVRKVKARGGSANPYAVCTASTGLTRSGKKSTATITKRADNHWKAGATRRAKR